MRGRKIDGRRQKSPGAQRRARALGELEEGGTKSQDFLTGRFSRIRAFFPLSSRR